MHSGLIGHTGFVGGNLARQRTFEDQFHSQNIHTLAGRHYDLLVCAGVRSEKWLANQEPEKDWQGIQILLDALAGVTAKTLVLISTVDVYPHPVNVDEETPIPPDRGEPFGRHRLQVETFVREHFPRHLIVRLPALFGPGLKKNFIYDLLHPEPKVILPAKFEELLGGCDEDECKLLQARYAPDGNGHLRLAENLDAEALVPLRQLLQKRGFTSLTFTDHDSEFQFYDLTDLWLDIAKALSYDIPLLNVATQPLKARDLAQHLLHLDFRHHTAKAPARYDMRSRYAERFGGHHGYLYNREQVLERLQGFVRGAT